MKTLVLGARGYLGRNIVYSLKSRDNYLVNAPEIETRIDLVNKEVVNELDLDVDVIFLMSGKTGGLNSFENYRQIVINNQIILLNLLDAIKSRPKKPHIIFPSTRTIYAGSDKYLEVHDEKDPKTVYAISKMACEYYLKSYHKLYKVPYSIVRIGIPYGDLIPGDRSYGTIELFLKQWIAEGCIKLFGDGSFKRTFTNIEVLCEVLCCLANDRKNSGIFNLPGEVYSLRELALMITQDEELIEYIDWPADHFEIETGHTYFSAKEFEHIQEKLKISTLRDWISSMLGRY